MKKSQISFKIKNEKNYDSIWFVGGSISLKDLKSKIKEKLQDKSAGPSKEKDKDKTKEDILVYDELTKQLITDDSTLIASDKKVSIERILSSLPQPTTSYRPMNGGGSGGGGVVIKHDKPEFICKLCKNQFSNPTLTRCCGDTACDTCLDKSIKQKSECPFCKKKVLPTSFKAGPNVTLQKMMQTAAQASKPAYPSMPPSFPYGYQPPTSSVILDYKQPPFKEVEKYLSGAKYFIIKSSNFDNIEHSIKHSEWATTKINETKLNNAFQRSKNVILIFSVNKSSQFQGYARMESLSTNKMNNWQGQESIKLGGTFKVLWLRICNVNFSRVSHLKNRFNNNEPIKKSRDTQEIPEDIGFEICKMFEVPDKDNNYYPIQEDRRRYMYSYSGGSNIATAGTPLTPIASSPREMRGIEARSSDSASETKVLTPNRYDESSERDEEVKKAAPEEKKKVEEKIDLLADLDFDEPIYFDNTYDIPQEVVKEAPVVEEPSIKEDISSEKMIEDYHEEQQIEDLPVSNAEEPTQEVMADLPASVTDQPNYDAIQEEEDFTALSEPRDRESQADFKSELERPFEEEKEQVTMFEEETQPPVRKVPSPPKQQPQQPEKPLAPIGSPIEAKRKSPSRERQPEEDKKDKKPHKAPPEPHRIPPAPQVPYGGHMSHEAMVRPPYMMDNRPPPPGMYPHAAPPMRYPYNPYPSAYPPNPYVNYPNMGAYPGMEPPNMRSGMNMNMNNPYYYYNNPAMWNMANRPFPYDNRAKPDGNEGEDDNLSQASDESESAKRKDKKRSKKEKKKKRKSGSRSRDRSRERSKSKTRRK